LVELGRRNAMLGQEDMVLDVTLDLAHKSKQELVLSATLALEDHL